MTIEKVLESLHVLALHTAEPVVPAGKLSRQHTKKS